MCISLRIRNVWAVYFSATGGTEKVVRAIARQLQGQLDVPLSTYDFTLPQARRSAPVFTAEDLVIFGTPVYAGRVPNVLLPYLSEIQGGGALAVPVVLYGNRAFEDALVELRNILRAGGFTPLAGCTFVGEHSFGSSLAGGRPNAEDLSTAEAFAGRILEALTALAAGGVLTPPALPGNDPPQPYFRPTDAAGKFIDIRRVKPATSDDCIDCKWCAAHCPMGSIDYEDTKQITGICIKCNACVKGCPVGAKHFADPLFLFHRDDILSRYAFPPKQPELFL